MSSKKVIKVIKKSEVIRPRKPLNLWEISGQQDLNLRPHGPQPCALPSYAIPRNAYNYNINELKMQPFFEEKDGCMDDNKERDPLILS